MHRSRSYRRYQRRRVILRKLRITKAWASYLPGSTPPYHDVPGKLAKGKIHCSCWMCRTKSSDELSLQDKMLLEKYESQMEDLDTMGNGEVG